MQFIYQYINSLSYSNALQLMEEKFREVVQQKICYVYFLQHEKVYTAGLKTEPQHILENIEVLRARRGGSVTVHNPGQLILYAVFPLEAIGNNLEKYIRILEESIITLLNLYHINGFQNKDHTGVWTHTGKIAFIGIGAKKGAVYHGAALNVCNHLRDYDTILSCGLSLPVTNMKNETDNKNWNLGKISEQWYLIFKEKMEKNFSFE